MGSQGYPYGLIRDHLSRLVFGVVSDLISSGVLPEDVRGAPVEISDTKQPEHGDFACNFAMVASKKAGMNPRQLGEALREKILAKGDSAVREIEVAGPGFLNFRLHPSWVASFVPNVLDKGSDLAKSQSGSKRINVEFVSVNPNGPITIGSGRGAAYGSTLSNVLQAAGNVVHREYYINDGVNSEQMRLFAESVKAIVEGRPVPDNGYKGDYVHAVAADIKEEASSLGLPSLTTDWYQQKAQDSMLQAQESALTAFGVAFDTWFSEQSLHEAGAVSVEIDQMIESGVADANPVRTKLKLAKGGVIDEVIVESQTGDVSEDDDEPNASAAQVTEGGQPTLWLRSTKFGDDMDRVLRRRDGRLTYIASDVAYHKDKFNRPENADKLITILGPDHHGYIGRLTAVVAAMFRAASRAEQGAGGGVPGAGNASELSEVEAKIYGSVEERDACLAALSEAKARLEVQIYQLVRFMKDGKPAPMRKRDGNIYALIDLIREIGEKVAPDGTDEEKTTAGRDVARFFYLMRSHDTTFDFDLDLAEKQSEDNPVFYVQYAHARICSVLRKAAEAGFEVTDSADFEKLVHERELTLIKKVCDLPYEVKRCAEDYGVHRLTTYAIELARTYHHFYDACRVIQADQPELTRARLGLCQATRVALKGALDLLGISAPERM